MPVPLKCPKCGFSSTIPDAYAGRQGKCPKCRQVILAPAASQKVVAPGALLSEQRADQAKSASQPSRLSPPQSLAAQQDQFAWLKSGAEDRSTVKNGSRKPRGRPPKIPVGLALAIAGSILVPVICGAIYVNLPQTPQFAVAPGGDVARPVKHSSAASGSPLNSSADSETAPALDKKPPRGASLSEIFAFVKSGIVKIEVFDGDRLVGIGSGFVIDKSGLIATNYHVVSTGSRATALFTDGTRHEIDGYQAVKPQWDLALLRLHSTPANLRVLDLQFKEKPEVASNVMAVGSPLNHPFRPAEGLVTSVIRSYELPEGARAFLKKHTGQDEQIWIEHRARIDPGNSGGPLFDGQGDVVGINTWVDKEVGFGYALWAWYIHDLAQQPLDHVAPLAEYRKDPGTKTLVANDRQPPPANPNPSPAGDVAPSAGMLQKLYDELKSNEWHPKSSAEYARFQELARGLTLAKTAKEPKPSAEVGQLADKLLHELSEVAWREDSQVRAINELALVTLERPQVATFLFGRVAQKLAQPLDGLPLVLIEVSGTKRQICTTIDSEQASLPAGSACLVLGLISNTAVRVQGTGPNSPRVPVLVDRVILPLPRAKD